MESKNLILRNTKFSDCELFAKWESSPDVTEFFSMDDTRDYEEVTKEFVLREKDPTVMQFTIVLKETEELIGRAIFTRISRHEDSMDLTRIYIAEPKLRGRGYGEEAMRLLLDYAFTSLHMERVTIDHFTGNKRAAALYQKLGFQHEGIARNSCKKNGKYYDLHLLSMLRTEYFKYLHD